MVASNATSQDLSDNNKPQAQAPDTLLANRKPKPPGLFSAELISDIGTPISIFEKLSKESEFAFLLESAEGDARLARFSFVGVDPTITVSMKDGQAEIVYVEEARKVLIDFQDPLLVLQKILEEYKEQIEQNKEQIDKSHSTSSPFPFTGGFVGYMGYGAVRYFENIPLQQVDPFGIPEAAYGLYDAVIVFDHQYRRIKVISRRSESHVQQLVERITECASGLEALKLKDNEPGSDNDIYHSVVTSVPQEQFLKQVGSCQELITAGEVFQIVLAQRFTMQAKASSLNIYRVLQAINPSPYAYLLKFPGFEYIGSSPETFVRCQDGSVMLRAIAGTRPRGKNVSEDLTYEQELCRSEKENAEHMMLVDLARNDVGRIARVGSVRVGEIAQLTKYAHVMHLSTEVCGQLAPDKTCFDAFRSCFPRGTVSGAPKIRAMRHLSRIEPEQRGIYSGVVGYFGLDGNMDGAIAIRSALVKDGLAHVNAGAGIVLDSDPAAEYEETRNKARSLIKAIQLANAAVGKAPAITNKTVVNNAQADNATVFSTVAPGKE